MHFTKYAGINREIEVEVSIQCVDSPGYSRSISGQAPSWELNKEDPGVPKVNSAAYRGTDTLYLNGVNLSEDARARKV